MRAVRSCGSSFILLPSARGRAGCRESRTSMAQMLQPGCMPCKVRHFSINPRFAGGRRHYIAVVAHIGGVVPEDKLNLSFFSMFKSPAQLSSYIKRGSPVLGTLLGSGGALLRYTFCNGDCGRSSAPMSSDCWTEAAFLSETRRCGGADQLDHGS